LTLIGRLRARITPAVAQSQLNAVAQRIRAIDPEHLRNLHFEVRRYRDTVTASVRPVLMALAAALLLVLLIACANVAGMQLAVISCGSTNWRCAGLSEPAGRG
jgi:hypothetical protein